MRKIALLVLVLLLLPLAAHAQQIAGIDNLLTQFQTVTGNWGGRLQALALGTFGLLAGIDLLWFVGYRVFRDGGNLYDFKRALIAEIMFLGFFGWLLTTFNVTGPLIIRSFQFAAQQAGGIPMQPNAIFAEGLQIATTITDQMRILHPAESLGMVVCGLVVISCFALIAASMVMVIIESYFIVSAGQILLMFGGIRFTSDIAIGLVRQVAGIGLKLYILQLIASVGMAFIATWVTAAGGAGPVTFQGIMLEIGQAIILLAITLTLPNRFERLITHIGSGGASDLAAAGGAVALAGSIVAGAVTRGILAAGGIGAAGSAAGQLASTQLAIASAAGTSPSTAVGRAAALVGSTASNMVSAKGTDVVRGLTGQRSNMGQASWRMAGDLNERNRLLKEGQNGP